MDIQSIATAYFDWADGKRGPSLAAEYDHIAGKLEDAVDWYQKKKIPKRWLARWLRIGAIVIGASAAAIPTLSEMALRPSSPDADLSEWLRPGVATILGLVVGLMIMLDKLIGASSGWVRYTMAETTLKELKDDLVLTYALEISQWGGPTGEPSAEQAKHALVTLQGFLARANQVVREETAQWKSEFQSALSQTEEVSKTQPRKAEETILTIKIANPERLAGAWEVSINDGTYLPGTNDSKTFRLTPGAITLRFKAIVKSGPADDKTSQYATEAGDVLIANAPKTIAITLPAKAA